MLFRQKTLWLIPCATWGLAVQRQDPPVVDTAQGTSAATCQAGDGCLVGEYCKENVCTRCDGDCGDNENCKTRCTKTEVEPVTSGQEPLQWGPGMYRVISADGIVPIKLDWNPAVEDDANIPYDPDNVLKVDEQFIVSEEIVVNNQGELQHFLKNDEKGWVKALKNYGGAPIVKREPAYEKMPATTTPPPTLEETAATDGAGTLDMIIPVGGQEGRYVEDACQGVQCPRGEMCRGGNCVWMNVPRYVCRPDKCTDTFRKDRGATDAKCRAIIDQKLCTEDEACTWQCDAPGWYAGVDVDACPTARGQEVDCEGNKVRPVVTFLKRK